MEGRLQAVFAVDKHIFDLRGHFEGAAVGDDDIRVFADFKRADPVFDADVAGRIDGDGFERFKRIHAGFYGKTSAQGQIFLGNDGGVRDDGNVASGLVKNPRGRPAFFS